MPVRGGRAATLTPAYLKIACVETGRQRITEHRQHRDIDLAMVIYRP